MPNITPAITSLIHLQDYMDEVLQYVDEDRFMPMFTFYLSPDLNLEELEKAWENLLFHGIKYYPKGGTTNSENGELGFENVAHILSFMQNRGIPLLVHGECPEIDGELVDDFEREARFYEYEMDALVKHFPHLKIVLEHITTREAVNFAKAYSKQVKATITPQHLLFDRRSLFNYNEATESSYTLNTKKSGIMPDFVCRPLLKHQKDVESLRNALIWQVKHGKKVFGLGTDTAYHAPEKKYCECGACGVFTAPIALELYAMAFDQIGIINHLSVFACDVMPEFYSVKNSLPAKTVILKKEPQQVKESYYGAKTPFAGQVIPWTATVVD